MMTILKQCLTILFAFLIGCHSRDKEFSDQFGLPLNEDRNQLSLAEVNEKWEFHAKMAVKEGYWNNSNPESAAGLRMKKIKWDEALELEWEQDEYISGKMVSLKKIDPDAGDGLESLTILYNYKLKTYTCYLTSSAGLTELPLPKAKAIKEAWCD